MAKAKNNKNKMGGKKRLAGRKGRAPPRTLKQATGRGCVYMYREAAPQIGLSPSETTFVVQGYGNVGSWAARILQQLGAKMVGTSDATGAIRSEKGIDRSGTGPAASQPCTRLCRKRRDCPAIEQRGKVLVFTSSGRRDNDNEQRKGCTRMQKARVVRASVLLQTMRRHVAPVTRYRIVNRRLT